MKKSKRPVPSFRISLDLPLAGTKGMREVLPFKRSWLAIGIVAIIDAIFIVPAVGAYSTASAGMERLDTLMDLVSVIFSSAWLLGWSIAPLLLTLLLVIMLFGREVIRGKQGVMELGIGLPGLMVFIPYNLSEILNMRLVVPEKKSGTAWRGQHIVFDFEGYQVEAGSAVDERRLAELQTQLKLLCASPVSERADADSSQTEKIPTNKGHTSQLTKQPHVDLGTGNEPSSAFYASLLTLLLANLVPIFGWWQWGWQLSDVMVLYWAESAVIGIYNLLKMAWINKWAVLVTGPFFLGHFGGFMAVHFLFIHGIFIEGFDGKGPGDDLASVAAIFTPLWPALLGLFISHGTSFFTNFISRKEYLGKSIKDQMKEPYGRIVFMHMVLIFGGMLAMALGDSGPVVLLVIVVKIAADAHAHLKQRRRVPDTNQPTVSAE